MIPHEKGFRRQRVSSMARQQRSGTACYGGQSAAKRAWLLAWACNYRQHRLASACMLASGLHNFCWSPGVFLEGVRERKMLSLGSTGVSASQLQ